jgi:hypothetical protein
VNGAVNQDEQLRTYVKRVHEQHRFEYRDIYVFYLPLTSDQNPNRSDLEWIQISGAHYRKITFDNDILSWLNAALQEWPQGHERMRENVSHYRNLIDYLSRKQKELQMNAKILEQLRAADEKNTLPTLSDLEALRQLLDRLQTCVQQVVRGKLLLKLQSILKAQGQEVSLCLEKEPLRKIEVDCPYDARFEEPVNVCVYASDTVRVCFGGNGNHKFWLGYMRSGSPDPDTQKEIEPLVDLEAENQFPGKHRQEPWYYVYSDLIDGGDFDKDPEKSSTELARKLIEMRKSLLDRLKARDVRL